MRVIAGSLRGRRLETLEGLHTRPTTARIKESIFNIIQFDIAGRRVLDLFAGSGQMGLETLSRGALHCTFVDNDVRARKIIEKNIAHCGVEEKAHLLGNEAAQFVARQKDGAFGLIFLDPPYQTGLLQKTLADICRFDILMQGGIIVCESGRDEPMLEVPEPYCVMKEYHYGSSKITTVTRR